MKIRRITIAAFAIILAASARGSAILNSKEACQAREEMQEAFSFYNHDTVTETLVGILLDLTTELYPEIDYRYYAPLTIEEVFIELNLDSFDLFTFADRIYDVFNININPETIMQRSYYRLEQFADYLLTMMD